MAPYLRSSRRTEAGVMLVALPPGRARGLRCRQATGSKTSLLSRRRCVHTFLSYTTAFVFAIRQTKHIPMFLINPLSFTQDGGGGGADGIVPEEQSQNGGGGGADGVDHGEGSGSAVSTGDGQQAQPPLQPAVRTHCCVSSVSAPILYCPSAVSCNPLLSERNQ